MEEVVINLVEKYHNFFARALYIFPYIFSHCALEKLYQLPEFYLFVFTTCVSPPLFYSSGFFLYVISKIEITSKLLLW